MAKKSQLRQFGLKPCTVLLRKLTESEVATVESTKPGLSCHLCQKKFDNKKSVDRHVKYYHFLKKCHNCEVCDRTFKRKSELAIHSLAHKDKTECPFPCSYCPKRYRYEPNLQSHVRSHLNEKPFCCVQCEKAYSSQAALRVHIINIHNNNRRFFACDVCNKTYANLGSLRVHKKTIHDNPTVHKCKVCGKGFTRKWSLTYHSNIHDPDAKMFECGFCESRFLNRAKLARHMRIHTKEKVECSLCNKQFSTEDTLRTHVRTMHCSPELADAFPCPEQNCTKKYATAPRLKQHMKNHLNYELWPFQCNFCNRRFLRSCILRLHLLSHTKERLFWCTQCPKKYKSSNGLKNHTRLHSSKTLK